MIRRTLLALALLAAPAVVMAQQPSSPMQGQTPATDTSAKAQAGKKPTKKHAAKKHAAKPGAKPEAKDTAKSKP